jgi:1,4-alpha-glucan branching enzyme
LRSAIPEPVGDLAIVLHSHMPYVEGFGTYPFGEEWLFDAFARSHLPVLEAADRLTISVTPVLADQLEAPGVRERMLAFLRRHRLGAAERDGAEGDPALRAAAAAEAEHYRVAIPALERTESALEAFQAAPRSGRIELIASAATHAVLPKLATVPGRRLQIDAGLRSHRRRFVPARGLWLPECAYVPGLEALLAERGLLYTCLDLSASEDPGDALVPIRLPAGPVGFTIDWATVALVWSERGYPAAGEYLEYHRLSPNGTRLWAISGEPYDPDAAATRAAADAGAFLAAVRERLEAHRRDRGRAGLCVFAIDTELLGHWWSEGPLWLRSVLAGADGEGVRLLTLGQAYAEHPAEPRPASTSSWGEAKTLETWDSPAVSDLAWAARRLELRLVRALAGAGVAPGAAERAARELLAVQSSDWAFMDHRKQAGDYPYRRAVAHAEAALQALSSSDAADPRMRNLAPDLVLSPLLEP